MADRKSLVALVCHPILVMPALFDKVHTKQMCECQTVISLLVDSFVPFKGCLLWMELNSVERVQFGLHDADILDMGKLFGF